MNINDFALTDEHKANLATLAAYLQSLPKNYKHFDMRSFIERFGEEELTRYLLHNGGVGTISCATVACAVGHGPSVGLLATPEEAAEGYMMHKYSLRVFGSDGLINYSMFTYLFGQDWKCYDNTHWGAAARIRAFLVGAEFDPDCYSTDYGEHLITKRIPLPRKRNTRARAPRTPKVST